MELAGRIALRPAGLFSVANHWASPSRHIKRMCLVKRDGQKQADFIGGYMQGIFELCDFASFPSLLAGDSCHFFDQSPTCFQHDFPQPNQNHRNATQRPILQRLTMLCMRNALTNVREAPFINLFQAW
jgi:hypothetical protein